MSYSGTLHHFKRAPQAYLVAIADHRPRYTIRSYGYKLNIETEVYRLELTLERVKDQQKSMMELELIPTPSELDDWQLYNRFLGEHFRSQEGDVGYSDWKIAEEEQEREREEGHRQRSFQASLANYDGTRGREGRKDQ